MDEKNLKSNKGEKIRRIRLGLMIIFAVVMITGIKLDNVWLMLGSLLILPVNGVLFIMGMIEAGKNTQ